MNWKLIPAIPLVASLAACAAGSIGSSSGGTSGSASSSTSSSTYTGSGGECNADPIQNLVGQAYSSSTESSAQRGSGSASVRVLKPGEVMTMEYDPRRLNIILNSDNAIDILRCG